MRLLKRRGAAHPCCTEGEMKSGISSKEASFLAEVEAESIGWLPLEARAYLHVGKPDEAEPVITIIGVIEPGMAGMNVLLLT